jgi:DNA sulfur modification protein DndD
MFFEEVTIHNFATYQGRQTISLSPTSPEKPVILIGGKNGCGKTTLLDALQLALFGSMARCSNRGKLSYVDYLERCINRDTSLAEGAGLELCFSCYIEGVENRFKISRTWNKTGKTIKEKFFVYSIKGVEIKFDRVLSENWNDYLESIFPSNIAHLFFFDGEKIEQLADFENSAQLLQSAIFSLLGLNVVDQLSRDLTFLEAKKQKSLKHLNNDKLVQAIEVDLEKANNHLKDLTQQKEALQNQFDSLEKEMTQIEAKYWLQGGELFDRRKELENNLENAQKSFEQSEGQLRAIAAGAAPLLLVKDLLLATNRQAKREVEAEKQKILTEYLTMRDKDLLSLIENLLLPQTAVNSINIFLQNDRDTREETTKVDSYLNLSDKGRESLSILIKSELPTIKSQINIDIQSNDEERNRLETIKRALAGVPEEEAIAAIVQKRVEKNEQIHHATKRLEHIHLDIERAMREINQKESELRKVLLHLAEEQQEHKDTYRLIDHSERVRGTMNKFRTQVIKKHISQIEQLVLDSFKKILRKKSLVHDLRINPENFQVELYGPNNNLISTERLSAGERQLLATSILWGICRAAGMPLPTIIDTPLGRLDSSHRTKLIQNYFPQASHQVILLSTDEEITGQYLEDLTPYISHTYLLDHDDNHGITKIKKTYFN